MALNFSSSSVSQIAYNRDLEYQYSLPLAQLDSKWEDTNTVQSNSEAGAYKRSDFVNVTGSGTVCGLSKIRIGGLPINALARPNLFHTKSTFASVFELRKTTSSNARNGGSR